MATVPALPTYRIDDIELDAARGCLSRAGQEIHLKPKAFQILVYLVMQRDRLVSKEELMDQFWKDTAVSEDVLAHSIAEVRRALGDTSRDSQYLKTVPKRGYRFVGDVQEVSSEAVIATERITTIQVREEYSDDRPPQGYGTALLPSHRPRPQWVVVLLSAVAMLCVTAAVALNHWGSALIVKEPPWWEVAWWKLNEGKGSQITDSIQGLSAILPAGVSWGPGVSGMGLLYTGCDLPVRGSDRGILPLGSKSATLTGWIKTSTDNGDGIPILDYCGAKDSLGGFVLLLHETGAAAFWVPWGKHFNLVGERRIRDGRWHQVTGVFEGPDSRRTRLYIDGAEDVTATAPQNRQTPNDPVQWAIGTSTRVGSPTFRGTIDDLRIYERALRADEIRSLYHCLAGGDDIDVDGGGSYYFAPLWGNQAEVLPKVPGEQSARVRNTGKDFAGVMFVRREPDCGLRSIHGANMGQDLNIEAELRAPLGPDDTVTDAGFYFRSRPANPGDGIIGGTSAGYWVRLDSTGRVRVHRLHPGFALAVSNAAEGFDADAFHKLEAAVHGETLEVALDGHLVTFDVAGGRRTVLQIPPAWETASPKGNNGGSAGIAFGSRKRGQAGGQEARNIQIKPYSPLRFAE